jgi:hypothetical protein
MTRLRKSLLLVAGMLLAGCQNADLLKPAEPAGSTATGERSFTRLGEDDPGPLTSELAYQWLDRIREASGPQRLALIDEFLADFPAGRRIAVVHEMRGDALAAEQQLAEASASYERALMLTRTDITGLPLDTELPVQLALTRLSSGDIVGGVDWLLRTSIADRSDRVIEGLRWGWSSNFREQGTFEDWTRRRRESIAPTPPRFVLPGLLESEVVLEPGAGVTLVNFWSPT